MIISASRRTDIPAFYAEWLINRIRAGYCSVLNPFNRKQISYVSLKPEDVEVLGELDDAATLSSGYAICPFVGIVPYPYDFEINPDEVEEIVEVPISAFRDTSCYRAVDSPGMGNTGKYKQLARFYEGRPSMAWFYEYDNHVIWGATARIVKSFLELIFAEEVE